MPRLTRRAATVAIAAILFVAAGCSTVGATPSPTEMMESPSPGVMMEESPSPSAMMEESPSPSAMMEESPSPSAP